MNSKETIKKKNKSPQWSDDWCRSLFLGPNGENDQIFEKILLDLFRDHVYWRRNFHPEDPVSIPPDSLTRPGFVQGHSDLLKELYSLAAKLKKSVPTYSPRYLGHMVSDTLIPAKLAYILGLLYNPNNVSFEVSPVTSDLEGEAIGQLSDMVGFKNGISGGHLTSGGTVANLESIRFARNLKALPILWAAIFKKLNLKFDGKTPSDLSLFAFFESQEGFDIALEMKSILDKKGISPLKIKALYDHFSFSQLGESFWSVHNIKQPVILAPRTAHYGWKKGAQVLGLGTKRLINLETNQYFRICIKELKDKLNSLKKSKTPIFQLVGVFGSTEIGAIDPIHELVELKNKNYPFHLHIDAAWGGYLRCLSQAKIPQEFLSLDVQKAVKAIPRVDSITIDPHKWGFMPYPAGAFIIKNKNWLKLEQTNASYAFDRENKDSKIKSHFSIGEVSLEGSKPGATAAMVALTHRICPLNESGMGELLKRGLQAKNFFLEEIKKTNNESKLPYEILVPHLPDSNIVTFFINLKGNTDLNITNKLNESIYQRFRINQDAPVANHDFFLSRTVLEEERYNFSKIQFIKLAQKTIKKPMADFKKINELFLLRSVLMNPLLIQDSKDFKYIQDFFGILKNHLAQRNDKET